MSFDYSSLAGTATRLISEFGAIVTLHLYQDGAYDPITGSDAATEVDQDVIAVKLNFNNSDIDGTMILSGDFQLLIDGEVTFSKDDGVTIDGVRYQVINSSPLKTGNTRLITKAQCRRS